MSERIEISEQAVIADVLNLAQGRQIILEGPPVYPFFGNPGAIEPDQDPNSPAFINGDNLTREILRQVNHNNGNILLATLLDDVHGNNTGHNGMSLLNGMSVDFPHESAILSEWISKSSDHQNSENELLILESGCRIEDTDRCSSMDSIFQGVKLLEAALRLESASINEFKFDLNNPPLLLIAHPESFVLSNGGTSQQSVMLEKLMGHIKKNEMLNSIFQYSDAERNSKFQQLGKKAKGKFFRDMLISMYRWVTYDQDGCITGYAKAEWEEQNGRFNIVRCDSLD